MDKWLHSLDERWRALSIKKQRRFTLYFFAGYLLLTAGVIFKVCHDAGKPNKCISIEHIENPVLKKKESPASLPDTLSTILKNKIYER